MVQTNSLVVVQKEALYNQNVDLLIWVSNLCGRGHVDAVGVCKLHWVLTPASNRVHHGIHVQCCDHCIEQRKAEGKKFSKKGTHLDEEMYSVLFNGNCALG